MCYKITVTVKIMAYILTEPKRGIRCVHHIFYCNNCNFVTAGNKNPLQKLLVLYLRIRDFPHHICIVL